MRRRASCALLALLLPLGWLLVGLMIGPAIGSVSPASAAGPQAPGPATGECPGIAKVGQGTIDSTGRTTPVVFIHGIISSPDMWNATSAKEPAGLAAQAAKIAGLSVYTFDYSDYSLRWVTDQQLGPRFAKAIGCLSRASRNKVVVVGHSMGGLVTKYAMSQPDGHGRTAAQDTREVITLGTPYQGSMLLGAAAGSTDFATRTPTAVSLGIRGVLALCGAAAYTEPKGGGPCKLAGVKETPAGKALVYPSPQAQALPAWPAGLPVHALGGDLQVIVKVFGHEFGRPNLGDIPVDPTSSSAGGTVPEKRFGFCFQANLTRLMSEDCFHSNLQVDPPVVARVIQILTAVVPKATSESQANDGAAKAAQNHTELLIDTSSSMGDSTSDGVPKIDAARSASLSALKIIEAEQAAGRSESVGIMGFSNDVTEYAAQGTPLDGARAAVAQLTADGDTNIGDGLSGALTALGTGDGGQRSIILLSDGMVTEGPSADDILSTIVPQAKAAGVCIYTVGFGDDADTDLLTSIAQGTCGTYTSADGIDQLREAFILNRQSISGTVASSGHGSVQQGQTVDAGTFVVPVDQSLLEISLTWPQTEPSDSSEPSLTTDPFETTPEPSITLPPGPSATDQPSPDPGSSGSAVTPPPSSTGVPTTGPSAPIGPSTATGPTIGPSVAGPGDVDAGNHLDLVIVDPDGNQVDGSYSGATILPGNPTVATLRTPLPGRWTVKVRGTAVPAGGQTFFQVSSRQQATEPAPASSGWRLPAFLGGGLLAVLALGGVTDTLLLRRRYRELPS